MPLRGHGSRFARHIAWLLAMILSVAQLSLSHAGQESYDYDALGRLIRVIDEQGRVTQYTYDAAGNLLQVDTGATAQAPTITSITPAAIRRGQSLRIAIVGKGLTGVDIKVSDPGLNVSGVVATATQVSFTLTVSLTATLGPSLIRLANAAGTATTSITINPVLPTVLIDPSPLAIAPDNVARQITIRLSNPDNIDYTFALSTVNPTVASISPASVTIPAGQTLAQASITGKVLGLTTLTLTSPTLGTIQFPVFVTTEFAGLNTQYAAPVGVVLQSAAAPTTQQITPVVSRLLGVAVGNFIRAIAPATMVIGTGPNTLTISGVGLNAAQTVTAIPPDGLTLGPITVVPDGSALTVPVTVASSAPTVLRQIIVSDTTGKPFAVAAPSADRLLIALTAPQLDSITPLYAIPGSTVVVTARGRNFQSTQAVTLTPSTGITVDASPVASPDGTLLTFAVGIAASAPVGPRTVVVTTPGGSSTAIASGSNTFTVVNQIQNDVTPIVAQPVGVVLQSATSATQPEFAFSPALGVSLGGVLTGLAPVSGQFGQSITLTLLGNQLQGVSSVQIVPNTGLTIGAPTVAANGTSIAVPVTIAANAPQTVRTVMAFAGTTLIQFAPASAALFTVTGLLPQLNSIDPLGLVVGAPAVTLTMRGANLQGATVSLVPPDGITIGNPATVDATGTTATVNISAAANAVTGPRAVVVTTTAGATSSVLSAANTITVTTQLAPPTLVFAPLLGVEVQPAITQISTDVGPVVSTALRVVLQDGTPPPPVTSLLASPSLGVAVGPVATGIVPTGFAPNATAALTVLGFALNGVTGITITPPTGVTVGALTIAPDGSFVSAPLTIALGTPAGLYGVTLNTATGRVPFTELSASVFMTSAGVPQLISIAAPTTPDVSVGTTTLLTIHGSNFQNAVTVTASPPDGITFANTLTVDVTGATLTIEIAVSATAPTVPRVIQVVVPGLISDPTAGANNMLRVNP